MSQPETNPEKHIDARYVADLARIELTDQEAEGYEKQLDDILAYIEHLRELDVEDIEPTAHAMPLNNVMREDQTEPSLDRQEVLANAPATAREEFFRVPAILENEEEEREADEK